MPDAMDTVISILFGAFGAACGCLLPLILNKMPARCFCDYDEAPGEIHEMPRVGKWQAICAVLVLAAVFPLIICRFGLSVTGVSLCLLSAVLVMIALSDLKFCIIPDELIIAGCLFALIAGLCSVFSGSIWQERLSPVFGAAIGAGVIFLINLVGKLIYKKDALGMGDLKLMAVVGIACGTVGTVYAFLAGILLAGIFFTVCILLKRTRREEYLPLGPFLVLGALCVFCFQPAMDMAIDWYISLI
jgi:prepilin signal peptidase PulO-like enzyme (type II secretory pathway)